MSGIATTVGLLYPVHIVCTTVHVQVYLALLQTVTGVAVYMCQESIPY